MKVCSDISLQTLCVLRSKQCFQEGSSKKSVEQIMSKEIISRHVLICTKCRLLLVFFLSFVVFIGVLCSFLCLFLTTLGLTTQSCSKRFLGSFDHECPDHKCPVFYDPILIYLIFPRMCYIMKA